MTRFPADDSPELDAILDRLLDLPLDEREAYLDEVCQDRPELRAQVERILAAESREDIIDRPVAGFARALLEEGDRSDEPDRDVGRHIGRYRLVREIGRGGSAVVYLAERIDGSFRHRVAIKRLLSPSGFSNMRERFLVERRILATLEHPNVARLYDAGVTDDGEPYVIMEYVEGLSITAYADERELSIDERLMLFEQVCDAVEYAHQNLVVHRDLKPSNILVSSDGDVKLLDFGIAKLLSVEDPDAAPLTAPGLAVLTPEYASPEQIAGKPISTTSDVYALGVILFELLAGGRPYEFETRSPAELSRVVLEQQPSRPSTHVQRRPAADAVAGKRRTTVTRLRRRLHGDLDTIVLMALRKEPARRYASAARLRDDLRRHREGLPVMARPSTLGYRAGKLILRHRVAGALVLLVSLSLIGGLVGTTWQSRQAAREAETAERVTEFLIELFRASDPDATPGRDLRARDLLDRGAARLSAGELTQEPETQARLASVIGRLYVELGLYDDARRLFEEALAIEAGIHGEAHTHVMTAMTDLVDARYSLGDFEAAEELGRRVLDLRRRSSSDDGPSVATSLTNLASTIAAQGRYDEAEPLYREALALERATGNTLAVAQSLNNLGVFLSNAGRYDESRVAHEEALGIRVAEHGETHTDVATSQANLAVALHQLGELARAEELLRSVIDLRTELLGPNHPHTALALNNLGDLLGERGELEEARAAHLEALAIRKATFGDDHAETGSSLNNLGVTSYRMADYAGAASYFREALRAFRSHHGEDHPLVLTAINNLASTLREQGELDEAERYFRLNLEKRRELLGEEHPHTNQALSNLGWLLLRRDAHEEARQCFVAAVARDLEMYAEDHTVTASDNLGLGRAELGLGLAIEAEAPIREAVRIRLAKLGEDHLRTVEARVWLAVSLSLQGRHREALPLVEENLPVLEQSYAPDHPALLRGRAALERSRGAGSRTSHSDP